MSVTEFFSDGYQNDVFGVITGTFAVSQFASGSFSLIRFKAWSANVGSFWIGDASSQPWELDAGDDTGWVPGEDMCHFWQSKSSGSSDFLAYWLQR